MKPNPLFVRPSEAALIISVGRSKIYEMIQSGEVPSTRIGGTLRIPTAALERFVELAMNPPADE